MLRSDAYNFWDNAWQAAMDASSFAARHNSKEYWDRRAASFAAHANHKSDYPAQFIKIIKPQPEWRVLDIGCGPGTIAIPLAPLVAQITAVDISEQMLSLLELSCRQGGLTNIRTIPADWEDDWRRCGLEPHDVVIASRSFVSPNLADAIIKLNRFARKHVFISAPVGSGPLNQRIMEVAGRPFNPGPDYIYIVNQLHSMQIYARLDFTFHQVNRTYKNHTDAVEECRWMVPDMTLEEKERLLRFFEENLVDRQGRWVLPDAPPVRWAVISWDVPTEGGWE